MSQLTLTALYRYPVKSLAGQSFDSLMVDVRGPRLDRAWMLVDPQGRFLTQRQLPRMVLLRPTLGESGRLTLSAPGMPDLAVGDSGDVRGPVRVWDDEVTAAYVDPKADAWLSAFLGQACRLVRLPDDVRRAVDPDYATAHDQVGFADGFPFLLISQASLDDLNRRLDGALPMLRFRPNLVVQGCAAYAEDGWRRIRIGGLTFRVAKPCSRCVIPTIDLESGVRGDEPMRTLLGYRRRDNKVYFGQNLLHDGEGRLSVGATVEVLE